jgi:glycosyltransferase involved in cell wall biosynthesis
MTLMRKISAYIIAYNEEQKIRDALNSVLWADEIILADSFSTDGTAEIAESMGARVVQIPFSGFGDLRNQAIKACTLEWIFSLDADERCTAEVRNEIQDIIYSDNPNEVYFVPRKNFFMGKWISHSGFYPNYRQPQLFRNGAMRYRPDPVHEGYEILNGREPGYLKNAIWQFPFKNFDEILHKASKYSSLGAKRMADEGVSASMLKALGHGMWSFFQHFFLKRGLFDGWAGFVIALGNFEGTFYKYAKLCQRQSGWLPPSTPPLEKKPRA